jgi:hypothetical protein
VRLFIVAAVVLVVFAIVASAGTSGLLFGVGAAVWFYASVLSFLVDVLFGGTVATAIRNASGGKPAA